MVVMSPTGGSPVVADVRTFGDYTECKKAAENRSVSSKAGRSCLCGIYLHREAAALMAPMADHPHTIDRWDNATGET